ncbi:MULTISPECIES: TetR/AcrR family transcriptional regulator [Bradyrhizobium]|uniref:TetR/AcrR family transcriptional regulator n=1 Tax=Bradyrhizobium betae TaxID=244734 RepID=A0AAE9SRT4_9BRAD|nr:MULTISPECIES: TetR/AcrR family transcriptional regulator [Bradyrhizobium]UUO36124.1 TetR/AcrR family transcriptional regulator [Bradyrhizobium sp. WBOS01]UUO42429.1 TetR/AcrR family transcriptional regulator [Bradyrhizobium sp. WBOS02]UUO56767.1 TetR/AcrR family transcriptional regulator [Bradyrhizobium sp. WBOS07]UUO66762.1 TetR/AcrR family transcriptional regulator [Bradyrhizobium betae]
MQVAAFPSDRAEEILVSASRLFARHSYANVTMEQVAASVRSVPGALYHYFRDKEDLIFHCYLRGLALYRHEIETAAEPGIDGLEVVRRFIRARLRPEGQRMILFTDIDALAASYSNDVHARRWQNAALLAGILKRGVADGSIACEEPLLTAVALISILDWVPFWFSERDYYSRQQAIDAIDDIITHGVYRREIALPDMPEAPSLAPFLQSRSKLNKRAAKLDRMLSIASDSFNRRGASGTSLESIAADAGMTRAGIYYHFSEKERLLLACLRRGLAGEIGIREYLQDLGLGPFDYVVQRVRLLLMLHDTPCGPKATYHNINYLNDVDRKHYVGQVLATIGQDQRNHQRWIEEGYFRSVDTHFAERVLTGMGHWYPIWFRGERSWSPMQIADHFSRLFLAGLKPRRGVVISNQSAAD